MARVSLLLLLTLALICTIRAAGPPPAVVPVDESSSSVVEVSSVDPPASSSSSSDDAPVVPPVVPPSDCPVPILFSNDANDANYAVSDNKVFTTCTTSEDQVRFDTGSTPPNVVLGISAETSTVCAEYGTTKTSKFGRYTCKIKAQNTPGVVTSCYLGSPQSGAGYQEIYFRFYGTNNTKVHMGFFTAAGSHDKEVSVSFFTNANFQEYSFDYQDGHIRWYINDVPYDVVTAGVSADGDFIPKLPGFFRVSYVTSDGTPAEDKKYGVFGGLTSTIEVANVSFVPSACNADVDISSDAPITSSDELPEPDPWARECKYTAPFEIYDDKLAAGIEDDSIGLHDLKSQGRVLSGDYALSWSVEDDSELSFTFAKSILLNEYWALEMWMQSDNVDKQIVVYLQSGDNEAGQSQKISLSNYVAVTNTIPQSWIRVQIPIKDFRASELVTSFNKIFFKPTYPKAYMGTIWFDKISFTLGPRCLGKELIIYDDKLADGWQKGVWGTTDFENTRPVAGGSGKSIYLRLVQGGIKFYAPNGVSTNNWYAISFDIKLEKATGLIGNPKVEIGLAQYPNGEDYKIFDLSNYYGGRFPTATDDFVTVSIPLTDFGTYQNQIISGFFIRSPSNDNQGKLFVDNVKFQKVKVSPTSSNSDSSFASPVATCSVALIAVTAAALML